MIFVQQFINTPDFISVHDDFFAILGFHHVPRRHVCRTPRFVLHAIKGGTVPREFIPAVEKGLKEALNNGVLAGFPVVDVKVTLFDGSYHDVDSSELAFKLAAI